MFTGIVEGVGEVKAIAPEAGGIRLTVALPPELDSGSSEERFRIGGSIAIDGACLTMTGVGAGEVTCQVIQETLRRTTLGRLHPGARVNLERPVQIGGRLEGHWVQGHVDGRARLIERQPEGESVRFRFELLSGELGRYLVPKGSVALDGVSLTVGEAGDASFSVYLIPHTLAVTALADRQPGDEVNVEVDILAKYMERLVNREGDLGMAARSVPPHARGDHR